LRSAGQEACWMTTKGPARALDVFADLDRVGDHAFNTIESRDQVARSGWVGFLQQICPNLLVGGDCVALDDEAGD
jgi:hypothetical protein